DTKRFRRGFQRSSCNEVNNKACLCGGQIEPILEKCHRDLAAHEGARSMPSLQPMTHTTTRAKYWTFVELLTVLSGGSRVEFWRGGCTGSVGNASLYRRFLDWGRARKSRVGVVGTG